MGQSSSAESNTSYQVLSMPAHTGRVRPKASAFPETALATLKQNDDYKTISELFQFPDSDGYKSNIYQFNWDSAGAPLAFFVPKTEEQISTFFRFYTSQSDLQKYSISIAGGRHSNLATLTDSIVIDMKKFKQTEINRETNIGRFGAGLKLGEFDAACWKEGLATTAGTNPDTGIAGLMLGGGFGYLARRHGMACDNVIGARVVLPNGDIISANESNEHKDLLWGLRGGGGNFGVVTEFTLKLYPQGNVYSGACVYIMREAGLFTIGHRAILQQWRDYAAKAPNDIGCMASFPTSGVLVLPYCYTGSDLAEGERKLAEAKKIGNPFIKVFNQVPYADHPKSLQWAALAHQVPSNYYESGLILREFTDGAIDVFLKYTLPPHIPNKKSQLLLAQLGGKVNDYGADHSPFNGRNAAFWIIVLGRWDSADTAEEYNRRRAATKKWAKDLTREMEPWLLEGTYNTLSSEEAEAKEKACTEGKEKKEDEEAKIASPRFGTHSDYMWQTPELNNNVRTRLVQLKRKYDPKNLLRNNKNINPNETM